jgi:hypothetical protein
LRRVFLDIDLERERRLTRVFHRRSGAIGRAARAFSVTYRHGKARSGGVFSSTDHVARVFRYGTRETLCHRGSLYLLTGVELYASVRISGPNVHRPVLVPTHEEPRGRT